MRIRLTALLVLIFGLSLISTTRATSEPESNSKDSAKESFSALAQLPVAGTTVNVRIHINGYSSGEDAQRLQAALLDGGPNALLKELQKMKSIGHIDREGTVGNYDFKFIVSRSTANGRTIYAVADRPIGFLEAYYGTRSRDYPFGILELNLKSGDSERDKGEGSLIYAAKIKVLNGQSVEIENLTFAPIRLLSVREL